MKMRKKELEITNRNWVQQKEHALNNVTNHDLNPGWKMGPHLVPNLISVG